MRVAAWGGAAWAVENAPPPSHDLRLLATSHTGDTHRVLVPRGTVTMTPRHSRHDEAKTPAARFFILAALLLFLLMILIVTDFACDIASLKRRGIEVSINIGVGRNPSGVVGKPTPNETKLGSRERRHQATACGYGQRQPHQLFRGTSNWDAALLDKPAESLG